MSVPLFRWEAPGPYQVAFSTRIGGVSEGAFESLNLGILTGDEPDRVIENRTRLCRQAGADLDQATMLWQQHGAGVVRAQADRGVMTAGFDHPPGDVLWTDEPGVAMMLITADCLPVALVRANGAEPALAEALGGGRLAAAIGPGIGPCCYEVGEEVAEPFRSRFGAEVMRGKNLDLYAATDKALTASGCLRVERIETCTSCHPDLFFSHRRDGRTTGRQGVIARVT